MPPSRSRRCHPSFGLRYCTDGGRHLLIDFRYFNVCQKLSGMDLVANCDVSLVQVTINPGIDGRILDGFGGVLKQRLGVERLSTMYSVARILKRRIAPGSAAVFAPNL